MTHQALDQAHDLNPRGLKHRTKVAYLLGFHILTQQRHQQQHQVGSGNKFTQMYENLRRDGVPFRGGGGGGGFSGGGGATGGGGGGGGRFRTTGGSVLRPGDEGYDEEADLAAAIFASNISATGAAGGAGAGGPRGGGAGGLPAASGGEFLAEGLWRLVLDLGGGVCCVEARGVYCCGVVWCVVC